MNTDYKSGLPIRSEADGVDERVHVKIVDGTSPASNQMSVDSDKNAHVEMHGDDPSGSDTVIRTSELGAITPDGVYDINNNTEPGNLAVILHERATTPDKTSQVFRPTGVQGSVDDTVHAMDISLHDEDGNPYSETNPLPVSISDAEGTEFNDYNESPVDVAKDASDTHTYTAAAEIKFTQVVFSCSGRANALVEVDPTNSGSWTKVFKLFVTTSDGNAILTLREPILISAGGKVRVTRTNRDNQPLTLYSTISGHTTT